MTDNEDLAVAVPASERLTKKLERFRTNNLVPSKADLEDARNACKALEDERDDALTHLTRALNVAAGTEMTDVERSRQLVAARNFLIAHGRTPPVFEPQITLGDDVFKPGKAAEPLIRSYKIPADADPELQRLAVLIAVMTEFKDSEEADRALSYLKNRFGDPLL